MDLRWRAALCFNEGLVFVSCVNLFYYLEPCLRDRDSRHGVVH